MERYAVGTIDKWGNFQSDTLGNDPELTHYATLEEAVMAIETEIALCEDKITNAAIGDEETGLVVWRQTYDYYDDVMTYADRLSSCSHLGNNEWERPLLEGCERPLTRDKLWEMSEWWATEAYTVTSIREEAARQIAIDLEGIITRWEGQ